MSEMLTELCEAIEIPASPLPSPDELSYYILEKDRKIYLESDIGQDSMVLERMILRWNMEDKGKPVNERKPIKVYIMSYGGDLDYMWSIVDTIQLSETPVITINMGVAASAAALIFLAGHERWMLPRAKVIIHEGSAQMAGDAVKVMDATESYRKELKRMKEFIMDRTEIPKTMMNKKRNNDWTIDADYCLENKVTHKIVHTLSEIL